MLSLKKTTPEESEKPAEKPAEPVEAAEPAKPAESAESAKPAESSAATSPPSETPPPQSSSLPQSPPPGRSSAEAAAAAAAAEEEEAAEKKSLFYYVLVVVDSIKTFVTGRSKFQVIALAVVLIAPFAVYFGYQFYKTTYAQYLYIQAEDAYDTGNYPEALGLLDRYLAFDANNMDAAYLRAKIFLQQRDYDRMEKTMAAIPESAAVARSADFWTYRALSAVFAENKAAVAASVEKALAFNRNYIPAYYVDALSAYFLHEDFAQAEEKFAALQNILGGGAAAGEQERFVYSLTRSVMASHGLRPMRVADTPFHEVQQSAEINNVLGFKFPTIGFNNVYALPVADILPALGDIPLNVYLYLIEASLAAANGNDALVAKIVQLLEESDAVGDSLFFNHIKAFSAAQSGDYAAAASAYAKIAAAQPELSDNHLAHANALWLAGGAVRPDEEVLAAYGKALEADADNVAAINNLAFMQMYLFNTAEAATLLERGGALSGDDKYILYNKAFSLLAAHQLDEAVDILYGLVDAETAETAETDSGAALYGIIQILIAQGKYTAALAQIEKFRELGGNTPEVIMDIVHIYRSRNQSALALAELERGFSAHPTDRGLVAEFLLELAQQGDTGYFDRILLTADREVDEDYRVRAARAILGGNPSQRETLFREALQAAQYLSGKNEVIALWLERSFADNNLAQVESALQEAARVNNDILPLGVRIAALRLEAEGGGDSRRPTDALLGDIDGIINDYKRLTPKNATALAALYIALEEPAKALMLIDEVAVVDTNELELAKISHAAYTMLGDAGKAASMKRRLDELNKSQRAVGGGGAARRASVVTGKGLTRELQATLNEAIADNDYPTAISIYTDILESELIVEVPALMYQNRGVLYLNLKDYQNAINDFKTALEDPELDDVQREFIHYNYAGALVATGQYDESEEHIKKALEYAPTRLENLTLYSRILTRQGRDEEVIEHNRAITDLYPGHLPAYLVMAAVQQKLGDTESAVKTLNIALKLSPNNPEIYQRLVDVYILLGDKEKAQEYLDILNRI